MDNNIVALWIDDDQEYNIQFINRLNNEGITIIMISHDILSSINYASHVLFVGKNTFFGTRKDFLSSDIGKKFIKFSNTQTGGDNNE
jgi:zinc transport system ATP-binding protein